jgi:O-antigen ligase
MTTSTSKKFRTENRPSESSFIPLEPDELDPTFASKIVFFIFCAAIVLTTLAYGTVHQPILGLFYVSAAFVAIFWALDAWMGGFVRFNRSLLQLPFVAVILLGVIQIIPFGWGRGAAGVSDIAATISQDPYSTQFAVIHLMALLAYFAAALAFIDREQRIRKLVYLITIFGAVFAFFAVIQVVLSPTKIYGIYEPRMAVPFGSFVNRHNFAAYMELAIALPLGLFFARALERDKLLLYLTAIVMMGIALFMSGSRGGTVSLVAEVLFVVLITTKFEGAFQYVVRIGGVAVLLVGIIVGTMLLGGESSLTRFAESTTMKDPTTSRTHIWATTIGIIEQNPLMGAGLNAFGVAYTLQDTFNGMERAEQAHNDYLQTLSDGGIVGGIIGLAFLALLFRTGFANIKTNDRFRRGVAAGALAGCFAILVHSMFDFVLHTTAIALLFLMLMALLVVSHKSGDEEEFERSREKRKPRRDNVTELVRR